MTPSNLGDNNKEYQTVILAALLHDIGKLLHRDPSVKGTHEHHSMLFAEDLGKRFGGNAWLDTALLKDLVENHSSPGKVEGKDRKEMARIVYFADSYSSGEREQKQERAKEGYKKKPLDSIFTLVTLKGKRPIDLFTQDGKPNIWRHNLTSLDRPSLAYPVCAKDRLKKDEVPELVKQFKEQVSNISSDIAFDAFFVRLLSLLERFTWCVPSDTRYTVADISLYDHLKSSSAIAACLYKYHRENELRVLSKIEPDRDEFILVGADLCGIQEYIYQITSSGEGGVAKRLRARSFYITALLEVVVHKILHRLELPSSCNLISAGGFFQLLVPNTEKTLETLESVSGEINQWLFKKFFGEIALNINWSALEGDASIEVSRNKLKVRHFFEQAEAMRDRLEYLKYRKYERTLSANDWSVANFKMDEEFFSKFTKLKDNCDVCGKFPAEKKEGNTLLCALCDLDRKIGEALPKSSYLIYSRPQCADSDSTLSFFDGEYGLTLAKCHDALKDMSPVYLIEELYSAKDDSESTKDDSESTGGLPLAHRFLANHIPIIEDADWVRQNLCPRCSTYETCEYREGAKKGDPYSFSCLAAFSIDAEGRGSPMLGILKADMDRLGLLFGRGFKEMKAERMDRATISRYLALSRMVDLFFSGWIQETLSSDPEYQKIYTVVSGGDDLFLVGPWETVINFAVHLQEKFAEYTCENESISLSAGIAVVKPKYPIARGAIAANDALAQSKKGGRDQEEKDRKEEYLEDRDRLTLFGTTVEWEKVRTLIEFKTLLNKEMQREGSPISTSFLHRLLAYREMYLEYKKTGWIRGLAYHSRLVYDLHRNILKKDDATGKKEVDENLKKVADRIRDLFAYNPEDKDPWIKYLNIPIMWVLYKNRGGGNYGLS